MDKTIGYGLIGLGILFFIGSYGKIRALIGITMTTKFDFYIMVAGVIIILVGAFMSFGDKEQPSEVPIYEGHGKERKIVGYQKMKK